MSKIILFLIRVYQRCISPLFPQRCRFYPTCSEYARQSVVKYGFFKGIRLSVTRISKCHPFHSGGIDLVPR